MTPLAAYLSKQITHPRNEFWKRNKQMLKFSLSDIHCFEVSKIVPLAEELHAEYSKKGKSIEQSEKYLFLPAPKTWIEAERPDHIRFAFLLRQIEDRVFEFEPGKPTRCAAVTMFGEQRAAMIGLLSTESNKGWRATDKLLDAETAKLPISGLLQIVHILLGMINTPRIIGRTQHMPNRAVERRLARDFGVGKFPLHAWNEIKLEVTKPPEIDDGEPHEAHLTGRRALHFCRAHLRLSRGKLEYVSSHWRGEASIGIKKTRYLVTK